MNISFSVSNGSGRAPDRSQSPAANLTQASRTQATLIPSHGTNRVVISSNDPRQFPIVSVGPSNQMHSPMRISSRIISGHHPHPHRPQSQSRPTSLYFAPATPSLSSPQTRTPRHRSEILMIPSPVLQERVPPVLPARREAPPPPPPSDQNHAMQQQSPARGAGAGGYMGFEQAREVSERHEKLRELKEHQREKLRALEGELSKLQERLPALRDQVTAINLASTEMSEMSSGLPEKIRQLMEQNCLLLVDCSCLQVQVNVEEQKKRQTQQSQTYQPPPPLMHGVIEKGQENTEMILGLVPPAPTADPNNRSPTSNTLRFNPPLHSPTDHRFDGGAAAHSSSSGSGSDGPQWACRKCTYLNSALLPRCEVCELPRADHKP